MDDASFKIPIAAAGGAARRAEDVTPYLTLYPVGASFYAEIGEDEARAQDEARWQIREGGEYEYVLSEKDWRLAEHRAVSASRHAPNEGRIRPGNYVGRLELAVVDASGAKVGVVRLESTSHKLSYREDYRTMLGEVAEQAAELVMSGEEQVFQGYEADVSADARTRYEQFAFVKSLVDSEAFDAAVARVCALPLKATRAVREERPFARAGRLGRAGTRQLVAAWRREPLPEGHALAARFGWASVPRTVEIDVRDETVDVPENRFVKFALETFLAFLRDVAQAASATDALRAEAEGLAERLDARLAHPLFREVSWLERVPLASPALQRREGYREILRAWLMFDAAAKLAWGGGEDVYQGGKRNVATLYEYWAFFKLWEVVSKIFAFLEDEKKKLLAKDKDGFELSLRQGKSMTFEGRYEPADGTRPLKAQFTYNKTFEKKGNLETQGSWTVEMRPDYTLSIWPAVIKNIEDAEKIDAVVHLHFDAKYRIEQFSELMDGAGTYKRDDLLKMHAYNDAIRRTYGSYILYPGDETQKIRRYHEIIPGIGAFVLRPGSDSKASGEALEGFVREVVASLQNRLTQRERTAVYDWGVRQGKPVTMPAAAKAVRLPQKNSRGEPFVPAEEPVLVGYCRAERLEWIKKNGYNFRVGLTKIGSLGVTSEMLRADWLLLHTSKPVTNLLFRIDKTQEPHVVTKEEMVKMGYRNPSSAAYLLFPVCEIEKVGDLSGLTCDISKLPGYDGAKAAEKPFTVTVQDLLCAAVEA